MKCLLLSYIFLKIKKLGGLFYMNKLDIGLVGYGYIGQIHTLVYKSLPILIPYLNDKYNMSLVVSKKLKNTDGSGWEKVYSSIDELESDIKLDMVDICTPNFLHYEQEKKFVSKGANIYCEKPMALNYDDSKEMADLAKAKGLITQVALVYRFMPAVAKAKTIIDKGYLGEIINFRGELFHSSYLNPKREMNWRLVHEKSGGGAIIDLGVHVIDTLIFILGFNKIKSVSARTNTIIKERPNVNSKNLSKVNVDDWGLIIMELENEGIGTIEVSKVSYKPDSSFHIEIYGTNGYLSISDKDPYNPVFCNFGEENTSSISNEINSDKYVAYLNTIYPIPKMSMGVMVDMHIASLANMMYNVLHGGVIYEETPTFEEGLKSQLVVELLYQSSKRKGEQIFI